jgi:hypothetical protein
MKYYKIKMVSFRAESRVAGRSREILLIKKDFYLSDSQPGISPANAGFSRPPVAGRK